MIGTDQVINGVWVGTVLLLLGLVPGLYQSVVDGMRSMSTLIAVRIAFPRISSKEKIEQPYWFAAAGLAVLLVTFAAYLL
jgi:hypothetical protein